MRKSHNLIIDFFRKTNRMPKFEASSKDYEIFQFIKDDSPNAENTLINKQIVNDLQKLIEKSLRDVIQSHKYRIR